MKVVFTLVSVIILTYNCFAFIDSTEIKYIVKSQSIEVKDHPSINSDVIAKFFENDTLIGIIENDTWTKITFDGKTGYVSTNEIREVIEPGFINGFKFGFKSIFFYIFFGIAAIIYYRSKRVKDNRYKDGHRTLPFTSVEIIKILLYSVIISSVWGLFAGILSWFSKF
jgi:ABC-type dipeptide/oligopeptide/nickel transport system permease component